MGTYRALIVACDFYSPDFSSIPNTVAESRALGEALAFAGYESFELQFSSDEASSAVRAVLGKFFASVEPDDFVLFYFGGHGRKDDEGDLYLVLRDTTMKELITTSLPAELLSKLINKCPAQKKVIVLDACYSAAIEQGARSDYQQIKIERRIEQGKGTAILTSANAVQLAYSREDRRSFTHYLTEGLKTGKADKDGDGSISLDEWFDYARKGVLNWQNDQPIQTPQIFYKSKEGDIFIGRTDVDQTDDMPIGNIPRSSTAPLDYGLELSMKTGAPYLTLTLINQDFLDLTAVQVIGITTIAAKEIKKFERISRRERVEVNMPVYNEAGPILQLEIRACDAHGRSFFPTRIQVSQAPSRSSQNMDEYHSPPNQQKRTTQQTPATDLDDDPDESILKKKSKKTFH